MTLLEAISPEYKFVATVRYSTGTNIARCNGRTASSTNSPEIAAIGAARKHFSKLCNLLEAKEQLYVASAKQHGNGLFMITFRKGGAK